MSLKQKTITALLWSAFERFSQQGLKLVITIILARYLFPEDYGLIGMLTVFIAIGEKFIESGFGQALIQNQDVTHIDKCSVFYFNIGVGILTAGLLWLLAPWIATFYNQSLLIPLTRIMSLNLVLNSLGTVQFALLTKQIDFKTQAKISILENVISGAIGITMAYNGYGIWSLVARSISGNFIRIVVVWIKTTWRPTWDFSLNSLQQMFGFGSRLLLSGIIGALFSNIYIIIIGKIFPVAVLGYYSQAKKLQQIPVKSICSMIGRVTFPVFSSIQSNKPLLKSNFRKELISLVLIVFPLMIGIAVLAKPVISILLTDKWLPCVPYLQLMCVIGAMLPLHVINLNVLKALGHSDLYFKINILKHAITIVTICITY